MSRNNINENQSTQGLDFIELNDVPHSYIGQANLYPRVNATEDGLIFSNAQGPQGDPGSTDFIGLTDGPGGYGIQGQVLMGNPIASDVYWSYPLFKGLADCPSNYGLSGQIVSTNGSNIIYSNLSTLISNQIAFTDLNDTPNNYGSNAQILSTNGNTIAYSNLVNLVSNQVSFLNLNDTPNNYGTVNQVLTSTGNGLVFSNIGGSNASSCLTSLLDYTGAPYSNQNAGAIVSIIKDSFGFQFTDLLKLQNTRPYRNFGMIKTYRNYPDNQTFIYDDSDDNGGYFWFGTYRTNYNEPRFLNDYWTTYNKSGGTYAYTTISTIYDIDQKRVGVNNDSKSCGVNINYLVSNLPPYYDWYVDIKYTINAKIDLGNIDDNIFVIWVQPQSEMDDIILLNTPQQQVAKADYFFVSENSQSSYPNGIADISITKIITFKALETNIINTFMSCRLKSDWTVKGSFTIKSYYYINICAEIVGFHPNYTSQRIPYP